jgi:hypothetical protein
MKIRLTIGLSKIVLIFCSASQAGILAMENTKKKKKSKILIPVIKV